MAGSEGGSKAASSAGSAGSGEKANADQQKSAANKQSMLSNFARVQYTFWSMILTHSTMFDWVAYPAFLIGDFEFTSIYFMPLMQVGYGIPQQIVIPMNYRGLSSSDEMTVLAVGIICLLIALIPIALTLLLKYQSEGTKTFRFFLSLFRIISLVYAPAGFLPLFGNMLSGFDCNTGIPCTISDRIPSIIVSSIGVVTVTLTSLYITLLFFDSNPTKKDPWNLVNPRIDLLVIVFKALLMIIVVFAQDSSFELRAFAGAIFPLILFILHNYYFPHYNIYITQIRCGIYFGTFFVGIMAMINGAIPAFSSSSGSSVGVILLAIVFCLSAPAGYYLTGRNFETLQTKLLDEIKKRKPESYKKGVWTDDMTIFKNWVQVDIAARFATGHLFGRRAPRREHFKEVICIFRRGLSEYPNNSYIIASYAQFVGKYISDSEHSLRTANKIDIQRLYPDTQLQIFMILESQEKQKELEFLEVDLNLDLATRSEYSRIIFDTKLNHYLTLHYSRQLWTTVLSRSYSPEKVENFAEQLQIAINRTEQGYLKLISKFPTSSRVRRYYSYFCLWSLNNDAKAHRLIQEADYRDRQKRELALRSQQHSTASHSGARTAFMGSLPVPKHTNSSSTAKITTEESREKVNKRLRQKLLSRNSGDIKQLLLATTIIGVIAAAVLIAAHIVVGNLLTSVHNSYKYFNYSYDRDTSNTLLWRRVRQLQTAYNNNDTVKFSALQAQLYSEMVLFQKNVRGMFTVTEANQMVPGGKRVYSDSWITYKRSYFPEYTTRVYQNGTLLDVLIMITNSAMVLTDMPIWLFNTSTLYYNNDYRMIADNWYYLQEHAYEVATAAYNDYYNSSRSQTVSLIYALTSIHIGVFAIFILVLDVVLVRRFRRKQGEMLEIFRVLPNAVKNEKLTALEETQQDDVLDFEQTFNSKLFMLTTNIKHRSFRNEYIAYSVVTIALAVLFAYLSITNVDFVTRQIAIDTSMYAMKTMDVRVLNHLQEILWNDTMTWGTEAEIRANIVEESSSLDETYTTFLFGDPTRSPPIPSADTYLQQDDLDSTITSCLAFNQSVCANRVFNTTLGYTPFLLNHGVVRLQDNLMTIFRKFAAAAAAGPFIPDETTLTLLDMVAEPDVTEGWQSRQNRVTQSTEDYIKNAEMINSLFLFCEVLTVIVGQFIVFTRMIWYFQFLDNCNVDLIVRLPRDIRKLPEFTRFLSEHLTKSVIHGSIINSYMVRWGLKSRGKKVEDDAEILKDLSRKSVAPGHNPVAVKQHLHDKLGKQNRRPTIMQSMLEAGAAIAHRASMIGARLSSAYDRDSDDAIQEEGQENVLNEILMGDADDDDLKGEKRNSLREALSGSIRSSSNLEAQLAHLGGGSTADMLNMLSASENSMAHSEGMDAMASSSAAAAFLAKLSNQPTEPDHIDDDDE
eukprot:jgi/Hompol1/2250/HPOL_002881-RA